MAEITQVLYRSAPVWLQNLAVSAMGWRLRRLRYGGIHHEELQLITQSQGWSATRLHELQQQRLSQLLARAGACVPYYRALFREYGIDPARITLDDLSLMVPVLPKEVVRASPERFYSRAGHRGKSVVIHTSGTSGSPLDVRASPEAIQRNYAFFARFLSWSGVTPTDRGATFAGRLVVPRRQSQPPYWRANRAMNTLLCSSYHMSADTAPLYLDALKAFRPRFIDSYPSAISALATFAIRLGRQGEVNPRVVVTSSETLLVQQRQVISEAFGCPVRDQYGSAEMSAFISQCEHGSYHVNPEYGVVEVLRKDGSPCGPGQLGELCCTGFLNAEMPLIRYLTGDIARFGVEPCGCGRAFPVVSEILGRMDDVIITPDGRYVGRLDPAFKGVVGVSEAQIVQESLNHVRVLAVTDERFSRDTETRLIAALRDRLGESMCITFESVARIPREPNGKFRSVVSRIREKSPGETRLPQT
jgi:phenylacetate-CoA ligase